MKNIIVTMLCSLMILSTVVDAKSFSRSSFSRSSFSRPSFSRPSFSKSKSSANKSPNYNFKSSANKSPNYKSKSSVNKSPNYDFKSSVNKFTKPKGVQALKRENAAKFHKNHIAKFKKPTKPLGTASVKTYQNNNFVKSSFQYDRSTRYQRRQSYYSDYTPPQYVYSSSPSFGMWDSLALWMILDNVNDRNYYAMGHNYRNDVGYQDWRREADRLSADNAELKAKLAQLDTNVAKMNNEPIDNNYVPNGVDRDILLSDDIIKNVKPNLNICSGSVNGSYMRYAYKMRQVLSSTFSVRVLATNGSNENVLKLESGECDIALTQRDVYDIYTLCSNTNQESKDICNNRGIKFSKETKLDFNRLSQPFNDTVIGICKNKEHLSDAKTIALVNNGGDVLTWSNLVLEFPVLDEIELVNSSSMKNSINLVKNDKADCTILVTNIKSKIISILDKFNADGMQIVNITNDNIFNIKDPVGDNVYYKTEVKGSTLGNMATPLLQGFFGRINTITVPVDVIISNTYNTSLSDKIRTKIEKIEL